MARDYLIKVWVKENRAPCVRPFVLYNHYETYEHTARFVKLRNIAKSKDFECYCTGCNCA